MAKSSNIAQQDFTVGRVVHDKAGTSSFIITKGQYKITVEKTGSFPSDFNPLPDDLVDITIAYTPR